MSESQKHAEPHPLTPHVHDSRDALRKFAEDRPAATAEPFPIKDAKSGDVVTVAEGPKKGAKLTVRGQSWNGIRVDTPKDGPQSVGYNLMVTK